MPRVSVLRNAYVIRNVINPPRQPFRIDPETAHRFAERRPLPRGVDVDDRAAGVVRDLLEHVASGAAAPCCRDHETPERPPPSVRPYAVNSPASRIAIKPARLGPAHVPNRMTRPRRDEQLLSQLGPVRHAVDLEFNLADKHHHELVDLVHVVRPDLTGWVDPEVARKPAAAPTRRDGLLID